MPKTNDAIRAKVDFAHSELYARLWRFAPFFVGLASGKIVSRPSVTNRAASNCPVSKAVWYAIIMLSGESERQLRVAALEPNRANSVRPLASVLCPFFSPELLARHQSICAPRLDHPRRFLQRHGSVNLADSGWLPVAWYEFGLLRFDGVRAVEWVPPGSEGLPSLRIDSLFTGRDGTLWIGTRAGLASWNGVKFTRYSEFDAKIVFTILEDHEGTIWVGGARLDRTGWLCGIRGAKTECYGESGSQFGGVVQSLYENGEGKLWAGASNGLWQWKPGPQKRYAMPEPELSSLIDGDDPNLLIATPGGIMQLVNGQAMPYRIRGFPMPRRPTPSLPRSRWKSMDRNGGPGAHAFSQRKIRRVFAAGRALRRRSRQHL